MKCGHWLEDCFRETKWAFIHFGEGRRVNKRESFSSVCSILLPLYYVWLLLLWQFFKQLNRTALSCCKPALIAPMHQACPHDHSLHSVLFFICVFHKSLGIVQLPCSCDTAILGQRAQEAALGRGEGSANFPCVSKHRKPPCSRG